MNAFDYLNGKRGGSLLAVYASILVIAVLLFLSVWIVLHMEKPSDLPEHICYLFGFIIAAAFGTNVAAAKLLPEESVPVAGPPGPAGPQGPMGLAPQPEPAFTYRSQP